MQGRNAANGFSCPGLRLKGVDRESGAKTAYAAQHVFSAGRTTVLLTDASVELIGRKRC